VDTIVEAREHRRRHLLLEGLQRAYQVEREALMWLLAQIFRRQTVPIFNAGLSLSANSGRRTNFATFLIETSSRQLLLRAFANSEKPLPPPEV